MDTVFIILIILLIVLSVVIIIILLTNRNNNELKAAFNNDLMNFSKLLNINMNNMANRLDDIENKINGDIDKNLAVFNKLNEKIISLDNTSKNIDELQKSITRLHNVLNDKKSRGVFGEIELYSLLETVFGINDEIYERQYLFPNNTRADAVIKGYSYGLISIDSKFPLEDYRRLSENPCSENRNLFRKDCQKHINDIHDKYIIDGVTADMAFMFVPSEAIYAEIYSSFNEIVDYSYLKKVYIVSPTTLMAYLTAVRSIYLGQKKNEKAREIEKLLSELSIEFNRLKDRNEQLKKDLDKVVQDNEQLYITQNKIINKFSKINSGDIDG